MTYPQAIQYLESFINYELFTSYPYKESLKLERIRGFLNAIDNPQNALRCIHVAGTKGKGSTCAFIAYILREAGYSTGLYTSPHLSDFRERIRVLSPQSPPLPKADAPAAQQADQPSAGTVSASAQGRCACGAAGGPAFGWHSPQLKDFEGMISKKGITDLVKRLRPAIEEYNKKSEYGPLSFFEVYTAMALIYFKEKKTDFVVLETGLGGRLDATNAVCSLVSVITPISLEHTQKLGNTLKQIAAEKAGIIKSPQSPPLPKADAPAVQQADQPSAGTVYSPHCIVISAPQESEALRVIRNKCKKENVKLYEIGKDFVYKKTKTGFKVKGLFSEYSGLKINLIGEHQLVNAATAVAAAEVLGHHNIKVRIGSVRQGLYNTCWPGRCEIVGKKPLVVLDGAQNIASASALKEAVISNFKYKKLILVLGISNDKDIKGVCGQFYDLADTVILTRSNNPRATPPAKLAGYFKGKEVYETKNVRQAKKEAFARALKADLILVTGSLFVAGDFRNENKRFN